MSLQGVVVRRNGALVVRYESTRYSEPIRDVLYWPLSEERSHCGWLLEEKPVVSDSSGPIWRAAPACEHFWHIRHAFVCLRDGDGTKAVEVESFPVPCPKVRRGIETRRHNGNWQKLLKTGWTYA